MGSIPPCRSLQERLRHRFVQIRKAMEEHSHVFDICIVCAMYEEAEAVLHEFSSRCSVSFESAFSQMSRYAYRYATIRNTRNEPLSVLVTWPADRGPVQTGLDLSLILQEFRPRFAAMTGICAGDRKKVKLGDLIVAECAYLYEEGKIIAGPDGQATHLIEAASLLGWAGMYLFEHGSYAITEPLYRRALAICEQQVGPDHPDTAISLNNLAALYHKQDKYELAEPLYQRALAIREQQLGPDHSLVAHVLDGLATLYRDQ